MCRLHIVKVLALVSSFMFSYDKLDPKWHICFRQALDKSQLGETVRQKDQKLDSPGTFDSGNLMY